MFNRNLDQILRPLGKIAERLESYITLSAEEAAAIQTQIRDLQQEESNVRAEADRARAVYNKLQNLLGSN